MAQSQICNCTDVPRAERIARLNDTLRTTGQGGRLVVTRSVTLLDDYSPDIICRALAAYNRFDESNDPHGERDFGDLALFASELLWKIDYYDTDLVYGSNDPADPQVTARVLTVMLASDW